MIYQPSSGHGHDNLNRNFWVRETPNQTGPDQTRPNKTEPAVNHSDKDAIQTTVVPRCCQCGRVFVSTSCKQPWRQGNGLLWNCPVD